MDAILARIAMFAGDAKPLKVSEAHSAPQISLTSTKSSNDDEYFERSGGAPSKEVGILCFSKDRPFQLEQFLTSTEKFVQSTEATASLIVLYSPGMNRLGCVKLVH